MVYAVANFQARVYWHCVDYT